MVTPRRSVKKVRGIRGFIVAFLAIMAAILLIAQPVAVNAAEIDVKHDGKVKKMVIEYNPATDNVVATVDGVKHKVTKKFDYPILLGKNTQKIVGIYPGEVPIIVFEGNSSCVLIRGRWIGYPPSTVCP